MKGTDSFPGFHDRLVRAGETGGGAAAVDTAASRLYPCSYTQRRIWYAQQIDPSGSHWNVAMRWRLTGRLREATVERAWQILVDRHEALRTGIEEIDGIAYQRVWERYPLKLGVIDISRLPEAQRIAAADEIARNDARKPLPLSAAPPLRLQLIRLDDDTTILLTNFHNIIVDGWSVGVLLREFGSIAAELEAGREPDLAEPSMQHVDYTLWQEDMISSGSFDPDRKYWASLLAGWKRFEVPTDKPRPPVLTHEGDIRTILLPRELSDALTEFAGKHGFSMFHIGAAMLSAALADATGNDDVFIGTQTACRDEPELATLVGPLINTAALRFDASGDPTLMDLLRHCRQRCMEAMDHQHLPFNFVVEALKPSRDPSRNLVYSITFTAQAAHIDTGQMGDLRFDSLTVAALPSFSAGAPTDLGFFMVGREEGWRLSCAGNTDLFEIATIDRLLARWAEAVQALIEHGGSARLSGLSALPTRRYVATGIASAATSPKMAASAGAAQEGIEARVAGIWKEILGIEDLTPETDFFDAGGTSLSALRMLSKLNKTFERSFPLTSLLRDSRLASFAAGIARDLAPAQVAAAQAPSRRPNVAAASLQPVIALNNGSVYRVMSRALGPSHPIIDVEVGNEADMEFAKGHNFVELAARVTDRTIAAQPDGPYVIMCYCALGPMALEVARQLETRGRRVRTLVMLNAVAPYYVDRLSPKARRIRRAAQVREALENFRVLLAMRKRGEISTASFIDNYSFLRRIGASRLLQRARLIDTTPTYRDQELLLEFPGVMRRMLLEGPLLEGRIDCDVVVFRTPDMLKGPAFPPALGWSDWVKGRVKVFDIGGKHIEILRESTATQIGKYLAAWLADEDGAEEKGVTV